jgi:hypothetical protein
MDFLAFNLSVVSSLVAGVLLLLVTAFLSEKARWVLTATLGRILRIDTEYVFKNAEDAAKDVIKELNRAKSVKILTGRGGELQRQTFANIFTNPKLAGKIECMLPITQPKNKLYWLEQREKELIQFDRAYEPGLLTQQIETTVRFLAPFVQDQFLELKYFEGPHFGRIILTDKCAYFTPYSDNEHGRDNHVFKYRFGGDMYGWLNRTFNQLWNKA